jgi:O-methyltransferase
VLGPALDSLRGVLEEHGPGSFDYVFIDADKRAYDAYYELALQLVRCSVWPKRLRKDT